MEATCSSETSVETQRTTWRHIPEDDTLPCCLFVCLFHVLLLISGPAVVWYHRCCGIDQPHRSARCVGVLCVHDPLMLVNGSIRMTPEQVMTTQTLLYLIHTTVFNAASRVNGSTTTRSMLSCKLNTFRPHRAIVRYV
jgi:hypothetical protein